MAELTKPPAMADSDLDRIAFGKLSDAQIAELARVAARRHFADGEKLFAAGERGFKFFVVESGEVEIVERSSGEAKTVTVHGPGDFTGDVDVLTGRPSLVSGIARGEVEAYEISAAEIRRMIRDSPVRSSPKRSARGDGARRPLSVGLLTREQLPSDPDPAGERIVRCPRCEQPLLVDEVRISSWESGPERLPCPVCNQEIVLDVYRAAIRGVRKPAR